MPVVELLESRQLLSQTAVLGQLQSLAFLQVSKEPVSVGSLPQSSSGQTMQATDMLSSQPVSNRVLIPQVLSSALPVITLQPADAPPGQAAQQTLTSTPVLPVLASTTQTRAGQTVPNPENAELTPSGLKSLPTLPMAEDVMIAGSLAPQQGWSSFKIPIDPATESLHVTVSHDPTMTGPMVPALDQLYLVGPAGNLMLKLTGASALLQGTRQDIQISFSHIPNGSDLVLRIIEAPTPTANGTAAATASTSATAMQPAAAATMPFTMEVVRSEWIGASLVSSALGQSFAGGSAVSSIFGCAPLSTAIVSSPSNPADLCTITKIGGPALADNLVGKLLVPAAAAEPVEETPIAIPGVSLGPLVSRGSAPLGPPLGTTPGDPTPALNRDERAFDVSTSGSNASGVGDSDLVTALSARLEALDTEGTPLWQPGSAHGDGASFVSLRGPGGFPTLATTASRTRADNDPEAILATVTTLSQPEVALEGTRSTVVGSATEFSSTTSVPVPTAVSADYCTAACGLVLGISLTAGPLYPDLLTLLQAWLRRKSRRDARRSALTTRRPGCWLNPAGWLRSIRRGIQRL